MDKDQNAAILERKAVRQESSPQQGGNLVWYMLGLGVLLLLMVTMFNSGTEQTIGWSDLLNAGRRQRSERQGTPGYIDIVDRPARHRSSEFASRICRDIVIGSTSVTAKVTRQRLKPPAADGTTGERVGTSRPRDGRRRRRCASIAIPRSNDLPSCSQRTASRLRDRRVRPTRCSATCRCC